MQQVIIFKNNGKVALMSVATHIGMTILEIGKKDVPYGIPFWIVDAADVPFNQPIESWVINEEDMGAPSGTGEMVMAEAEDIGELE